MSKKQMNHYIYHCIGQFPEYILPSIQFTFSSLPRIENDLPPLAFTELHIRLRSVVEGHDTLDERDVPADAAEDVLAAPQEVGGKREDRAHGAASELERGVLVVELPPCERDRRGLVHAGGDDGAEGPDEVVCERERGVVADDLWWRWC